MSTLFGTECLYDAARLVFLPVPWDATTSYGQGAALGPDAILEASQQVDLFDSEVLRPYETGLYLAPAPVGIADRNQRARLKVEHVRGISPTSKSVDREDCIQEINEWGAWVNNLVYEQTLRIYESLKNVAVVGGDHSVSYGAIKACAERTKGMGILHFDAHCDLRNAYEGFQWSHASILRNVMDGIPGIQKLVQVGVRDFCEEEWDYARKHQDRIGLFTDSYLKGQLYSGSTWAKLCAQMIESLPPLVWISFDVDGLDPKLCPSTGTPVPGGLEFSQAMYLIKNLVESGRKIVGFDLVEVAPGTGEWDANVGARLLYKLAGWMGASQGWCPLRT